MIKDPGKPGPKPKSADEHHGKVLVSLPPDLLAAYHANGKSAYVQRLIRADQARRPKPPTPLRFEDGRPAIARADMETWNVFAVERVQFNLSGPAQYTLRAIAPTPDAVASYAASHDEWLKSGRTLTRAPIPEPVPAYRVVELEFDGPDLPPYLYLSSSGFHALAVSEDGSLDFSEPQP